MVLFEVINPVSVLLQIALVVCKTLTSVWSRKHMHTLFLATAVAAIQSS